MNNLFSEIYGCYFNIVARVLSRAQDGIEQKEIQQIMNEHGFSETAFHLLPSLIDGEWNFLDKRGNLYYSNFAHKVDRPITKLELSWLKALLNDPRLRLFLSDETFKKVSDVLKDIAPIFNTSDFASVDMHADGDPYSDCTYIENFKKILHACKNNEPLCIAYDGDKSSCTPHFFMPYKLSYSFLNDKFRLLCATTNKKTGELSKATLSLNRIVSVQNAVAPVKVTLADLNALFLQSQESGELVVEVTKERNALERFLLQFASYDRKTYYDASRDICICHVFYDLAEETELLIKIMGFGATIKVLSPPHFIKQLKERLTSQLSLMNMLE